MNYTLTYSEINITNDDFHIDNSLFENKQEVYFIPSSVFDVLKSAIKIDGNNNYSFISNYLKLVNALLKAKNELSSYSLYNINQSYKSFITLFQDELIDSKTPYSAEAKRAFRYNIKAHNKWTFLILEEVGSICIKEYSNDLDKNHVCNNEVYIDTLCLSTINIDAAIKAEYDYFLADKLFNDKRVLIMSTQQRNKLFAENVIKILRFTNKRYIKKGNNIDRVFNSFCELSSRSRKFVQMNNQYFIELDIKNCMPLLVAATILKNKLAIDKNYVEAVENGTFYKSIQEKANELGIETETIYQKDKTFDVYNFTDLDDVKRLVCSSVLYYSKTINQSKTTQIFEKLYPKTYKSLNQIFKDTNKPAGYFFNLEANIVLNIVPNCHYYTVHDAIYVIDNVQALKVKEQLVNKILELTGGLLTANIRIKNAVEVYKSNSKCVVNKINILSKRKTELKPRKQKTSTEERLTKFKELIQQGETKEQIINVLNITSKTYLRYQKSLSINKDDSSHIEEATYVINKSDYVDHLNTILDHSTISHRLFRAKYDGIIEVLVKSQVKKKKKIIELIKTELNS